MGLSPAAQAKTALVLCHECIYGERVLGFYTMPEEDPKRYEMRKSLVWMKRTLRVAWICQTCGDVTGVKVAMERPERRDPPIRKDRVAAIRNLKRAGYRFFEWEKSRV